MRSVKFNHQTLFYILFIQTKKEQTKQNVVKIINVVNLPIGR